jgi:hypothetical protein
VEELLHPVLVLFHAWQRFLMLDEVVREVLAESVDVSSADQRIQAPHRGLMIHRATPVIVGSVDEYPTRRLLAATMFSQSTPGAIGSADPSAPERSKGGR